MRGDSDRYDVVAELLAAAIADEGRPPCGDANDRPDRCPFWRECATKQHACHEFFLWSHGVAVKETGEYQWKQSTKVLRVQERNPTADMYRKVFVES